MVLADGKSAEITLIIDKADGTQVGVAATARHSLSLSDSSVGNVFSGTVWAVLTDQEVGQLTFSGDFNPVGNTSMVDTSKTVYTMTDANGDVWYAWARQGSGYHITKAGIEGNPTGEWYWELSSTGFASSPDGVGVWMRSSGAAGTPAMSMSPSDLAFSEIADSNILTFATDKLTADDLFDQNGISVKAGSLVFDRGALTNSAGNEIVGGAIDGVMLIENKVDTVAPTVASFDSISIGDSVENSYEEGDTVVLKFNELIDVSRLDLAAITQNGYTLGVDAQLSALNPTDDGYATTFVVTLGAGVTLAAKDVISFDAAAVEDKAGTVASSDVDFIAPDPAALRPAAALVDPVTVGDEDAGNAYSAADTVTLTFNKAVKVSELSLDRFNVPGKSFGAGARVDAINADAAGYATQFRITLGSGSTVVEGEQISIDRGKVIDTDGVIAQSDVKFTLTDITPPSLASSNTISAVDVDNSNDFNATDTLTVIFKEAVKISSLTEAAFSVTGKSLGTGFSVTAIGGSDGYSTQFKITLGNGAIITESDVLTINKAHVLDAADNKPAADLTLSIPSIVIPAAAESDPISIADTDDAYGDTDAITLNFNKPVKISNLALTDFTVAGKTFGAGAILAAGTESPPGSGYTTQFTIMLGAGADVSQGDQISVDGTQVIDSSATSASGNVVFILPDITPPGATGSAVPADSGAAAGTYDSGDTLTINFDEGIKVSEITDADLGTTIKLDNGHIFGTGATIVATNEAANGFATQFTITLGTGTDVASSDTIALDPGQIKDATDNSPTAAQAFNVPAVSVPTISSITVPDDNYKSGDAIAVTVNFSEAVTVDLGGGTMTLKLDVGGSEVLAEYTGGSGSTALTFTYYASGVIDSDGITVQADAINKNLATIKNANGEDAELTNAGKTFANAQVNAPFSVATAADLWLDGMDVDGDGDIQDQSAGDAVSEWRDKSGKGNHLSTDVASRKAAIETDAESGNLAVRFRTGDYLVNTDPSLNSDTSYTYFYVAKVEIPPSYASESNYIFGTRPGGGFGYFSVVRPDNYFASKQYAMFGAHDDHQKAIQTANTEANTIFGESLIEGQSRVQYLNSQTESFIPLSNIKPGTGFSVGASLEGHKSGDKLIQEVLAYSRALSDAETTIVRNYLSSKWNVDIGADSDYYSGDTILNGDYDYYVTGILKLADSNVASGKQGALTISNSSTDGFLKDTGDAVFAGYKGEGIKNTELPASGIANVRSGTVWYFDATDAATAGGNINLSFDLSKLGLDVSQYANDYVLLWRSGRSGKFYEIATADVLNNGTITFEDIDVNTTAGDGTVQTSTDLIKDGYITVAARDGTTLATPTIDSLITNDAAPVITGTVGDSALVTSEALTVTVNDAVYENVSVDGDGRWRVDIGSATPKAGTTLGSFIDGTSYEVTAVVRYVAGSSGPIRTNEITIDTTGPISGDVGSNRLAGTNGDEILTGGGGKDTFVYNGDDGDDIITDFSATSDTEGDVLDLRDLLEGYDSNSNLSDFLQVTKSANDTVIHIDSNGTTGGSSYSDVSITLQGVDTTLADLETNNNLLVM